MALSEKPFHISQYILLVLYGKHSSVCGSKGGLLSYGDFLSRGAMTLKVYIHGGIRKGHLQEMCSIKNRRGRGFLINPVQPRLQEFGERQGLRRPLNRRQKWVSKKVKKKMWTFFTEGLF